MQQRFKHILGVALFALMLTLGTTQAQPSVRQPIPVQASEPGGGSNGGG